MKIIRQFGIYLAIYIGYIGLIWTAIEMASYFTEDYIRKLLGNWWVVLYFIPLPFILTAIFLEYFRRKPVDGWISAINEYCRKHCPDAIIYGAIDDEPEIEITGAYPLSAAEETAAAKLRKTLDGNDLHGMVSEEPVMEHSPIVFRVRTLDYAALEVLRNKQKHEYILSANVVIVCREKRMLILHHRSENSRTYDDCLHTVGGGFQPAVGNRAGDFNLLRTARREVDEEIGASVLADETPPMILALEPSNRFIQLVFLGANISAKQCDRLKSNWEGQGIVKIPFDELGARLRKPIQRQNAAGEEIKSDWVPSGKAHVLAWLAHGAPGAGLKPKFGKLSPEDLFKEIVKT